jgi:hypothetical protein
MATPIRIALSGVAVAVVAAVPSLAGLQASDATDRSEFAAVAAGSLQMRFIALDGVAVVPTQLLEVTNPPVPSTFRLRHVVRLRNAGSAAIGRLALAVEAGRGDSRQLAERISVAVEVSDGGDADTHSVPGISLSGVEDHAPIALRLPRPVVRGHDVDVTVTMSASGLDNSFEGAQVNPRFTLIGGA